MIQRIQTLYFLLIVVLGACAFYFPIAILYNTTEGILISLNYEGFSLVEGESNELIVRTWWLSVLSFLIPTVAFVSIFLFKKRILQIRLSFINIFFMLGYYLMLFIYLWQGAKLFSLDWSLKWSLEIPAGFPLACIILNWLAIRAIGKDEALIKSLNRLR